MGHDVTVASPYIGGDISNMASSFGVKVLDINSLSTADTFDIIHTQHKPITEFLIKLYPDIPKVTTIHSEIISLEEPILHKSIKHYIAIRPQIKDKLMKTHHINDDMISIVYNPIDENKFKISDKKLHNSVLFVGTVDYLRRDALFDLLEYTKNKNMELWIVGDNNDSYLNELICFNHVKYSKSVNDVEKYVHRCNETAGILLGRSTIEGWMCGKPGWIYNVDDNGKILDKSFNNPPNDLSKFYSSTVCSQIIDIYENFS